MDGTMDGMERKELMNQRIYLNEDWLFTEQFQKS